MDKRRYSQALLLGGAAATVAGAALVLLPLVFVGLIGALMGSAGLGIFPRKRLVSDEQQKQVQQVSTYVNAGAPIIVVAALLLGANQVALTFVLAAVLLVDIGLYAWMSRLGEPIDRATPSR